MKCVGIQYIEALGRLKRAGVRFLRTIHLTYVPGMAAFPRCLPSSTAFSSSCFACFRCAH